MIAADIFKDKEVAVFGLGLSGISAAKSLLAGGARVAGYDDREEGRSLGVKYGIPYVDLHTANWRRFSALVLAPGVPLTHPKPHWTVEMAQKAGIEIIGDTELFYRAYEASDTTAKIIAITGTNGKSTTSALIAHCLNDAGVDTELGGNIGNPVLDLAPFADDKVYVLEMSSYQIDLTPGLKPTVAIHLNITADHLDRHGTIEQYAAVKAKIFNLLEEDRLAVVGDDDQFSAQIADGLMNGQHTTKRISATTPPDNGIHFGDGFLQERAAGRIVSQVSLKGIKTLRGTHNAQNAAAASAAITFLGVPTDAIEQGFKTFPGLEHRMEVLGHVGKVLCINDSKATNADAASKALSSFEDIYWIAGGQAKDGGIQSLQPFHSKISKAYLIGECANEFASTLGDAVENETCNTIDLAAAKAIQAAATSDATEPVVMLSPAAASFDQYDNFMQRGDAFREAVSATPGFVPLKTT